MIVSHALLLFLFIVGRAITASSEYNEKMTLNANPNNQYLLS